MINSNSAIAIYGKQDETSSFIQKAESLGVKIVWINQLLHNQTDLGSKVSDLVNESAALFIFDVDEELNILMQFFQAANKNVYFVETEEKEYIFPRGVKRISNPKKTFLELIKENEQAVIDTKIGKIELRFNAFGLSYLQKTQTGLLSEKLSKQSQKVKNQLEAYFEGKRKTFNLKVYLKGTAFQRKVWNELAKIPYNHTITYGELANNVGDTNASRAVGLNISKNPIWIIIPCHRVLSKEGDLTGYAGGLLLKQALLDLESQQMSLF